MTGFGRRRAIARTPSNEMATDRIGDTMGDSTEDILRLCGRGIGVVFRVESPLVPVIAE